MTGAKRALGVTLIELLIVISIMMTMLSLVGGLNLQTFKKTEAQAELISFYSLVKKAGMLAFTSGGDVVMKLSENLVTVVVRGKMRSQKSFVYLSFESQKVFFNRSGLPNKFGLIINVNGREKSIDLGSMFNSWSATSSGTGAHVED